ncbi:MAG: DNA helicase RecQ [Nitrospira sp.]|nr:DNA helicase RecQ [Nitrospira sp.]MCY4131347.1 DNA helicase RecQ [Nitrospira sp.]
MKPLQSTDDALRLLRTVFGHSSFRLRQEEVIGDLLAGRDAMVLMPTGGGKSLCYQVPAMMRAGVGVVVSPLIALMKDQVDALRQCGVRAACLNSTLDFEEVRAVEAAVNGGRLDLLYVAPERLLQERTLEWLDKQTIALFAIDEAHCVSRWGHDFREEYLQLSVLHERYPSVPRIALTATADHATRREIITQLQLEEANVYIHSCDRPNIRYAISGDDNGRERMWRFLQSEHPNDAGIVYCLTRKKVEEIAEWLCARGRDALPYHAGLADHTRRRHQERFLREEGVVIVATVAFGMGIDKPDVRFVAHLSLPKSIEAYYQETGRAGRDGLPASAWMNYGLKEIIVFRQWLSESEADEAHKRVEHQKLEAMIGLCELPTCRRRAIRAYFGEEPGEDCGNCDNCLDPPQTWDGTEAAQKALSCVSRTGQRFGVNYLVDVLIGKDHARIRDWRHDRLDVFGMGAEHGAAEWRSIFRQLIAQGCLWVDAERFDALRLTEQAFRVLRGECELTLRRLRRAVMVKKGKVAARPAPIASSDEALWEALRKARTALAKEQGVPPYVVFHDTTLRELVQLKPTRLVEMERIQGVGEHKLRKYGEAFLRVMREHVPAERAGE